LFNVIKGEMIRKTSKPVIIGQKRQSETSENLIGKVEESEAELLKTEIERMQEEVKLRQNELRALNEELAKRQENMEEKIKEMEKNAAENIEYEKKVSQNRGYQDGYQEGLNQGKEEVIENSKRLIIRAQSILNEVVDHKTNLIEENEENLINLAIKIAEKIIKQEIKEDREIIRNNLKDAIKMVPVSKELTIIVNWEDLEYIKEIREKLISEINGVEKIEIIENANIEKGGCILETSMGTIDASINSQIEAIYEKFIEIMANSTCNKTGCELEVNKDELDI